MRELYLRSFEIAIKEARMTIRYYGEGGSLTEKTMRAATAVMPAQNCVGATVGHANYALLTGVLRQEWGFQGMVVSDYWVWGDNALRDLCLRTGCDTYLCMFMPVMWNLTDYDSPTARSVMRNAIHIYPAWRSGGCRRTEFTGKRAYFLAFLVITIYNELET